MIDAGFAVLRNIGVVGEIARHQVDRALDALIGSADATRDGAEQGRLSYPDIAFEQHVTTGKGRDTGESHCAILADDGFLDLRLQA